MKIQALMIFSLIFIMNCKGPKSATSQLSEESDDLILIAKGNLHGSGAEGISKQNTVLTSEDEWKYLVNQMNLVNNVSDRFVETEVDFDRYWVVAIFNDVMPSGGYHIEVDVFLTSKNTVLRVTHMSPSGKAASVMTQPFYIAKIKKTDLPIVFE